MLITHYKLGLKYIMLSAVFLFYLSAAPAVACNENLSSTTLTIKGYSLSVEMALTPSARACGLSHRWSLPESHGMLFIYPNPRPLSFWMKDTKIPLSIAFIDDTGRIFSIQKMAPMQIDKRYRSSKPARYAIEVNRGWFEKHNIVIGDIIDLQIPAFLNIK